MKVCKTCQEIKDLNLFGKDKRSKDEHLLYCKRCVSITNRRYRENNPAAVILSREKWNTNNPEKKVEYAKKWEKLNKVASNESSIAWQKRNRDKTASICAKRRAAKLLRTPKWLTEQDWHKIKDFYKEANRLTKLTGIKYEVDHILPLQGKHVSGLHHPDNLQILTKHDNLSKGNKKIDEVKNE